jgi:LPXTG-motif cell wall-anchored protein
MITFEGYNDRILTWGNLTTVCPNPSTPDPESPAAALPATGVDATAVGGIAAGAGVLALVGLGLVVARRRQLS